MLQLIKDEGQKIELVLDSFLEKFDFSLQSCLTEVVL